MDTSENIRVMITQGPLGPVHESESGPLACDGAGALVCFEGVVRPTEDERAIVGIRYETYEPMAQKMLAELARRAIGDFGVLAIHVEHSDGLVPNFMCSFRMQVASTHRKEGLAAMDWFIDAMKRDVPIWKHLVWVDSQSSGTEMNNA